MPSEFVHAVTGSNLVNWYLLPLIHLNKFSFGNGNFLEAYVTTDGTVITVEVVSIDLIPGGEYRKHYLYLEQDKNISDGYDYIYYRLPPKWSNDFELFKAGQFSKFSDPAKENIMEYSGLIQQQNEADGTVDARLLALGRSILLQEKWEEDLELPSGHLRDQELLDIPPPRNYRPYTKKP